MNWEAIGAIGEIIGALAVVVTLVILTIQMRQSTNAMKESNRLARSAALDRHAESVGRWRASLVENAEVARIWHKAQNKQALDEFEILRLNNLFINFTNLQRANFERAHTIGETGLARQAARSIAAECPQDGVFCTLWEHIRPWQALASQEFVKAVDAEIVSVREGGRYMVPWQTLNAEILANQAKVAD